MYSPEPKERIYVALDVPDVHKAIGLVEKLHPHVGGFKIGLEFITSMLTYLITCESNITAELMLGKIRQLFHMLNGKVFWDGKFDDIPNTVAGASVALKKLQVKMFNVHASAGLEAMRQAVAHKNDSLVLAVTVLTSLNDADCTDIFGAPSPGRVVRFAHLASKAGCDGIVCSPQEIALVRRYSELDGLVLVTPGIRSKDSPPDDQKRTMTVEEAVLAGANYLVIGRPITTAVDPVAAAKQFAAEIS